MRFWGVPLALPLLGMLVVLGNCTLLPASGPATMDIMTVYQGPTSLPYAIVQVSPKVIDVQARNAPRLIAFADRSRPKDILFGVGDIVSVTVFEAASGGLSFQPKGGCGHGNFITIPKSTSRRPRQYFDSLCRPHSCTRSYAGAGPGCHR